MAALTGATGTVDWSRSTKDNHISLFCQFMATATISKGSVAILEVTHNNNVFRIGLDKGTVNQVWGFIQNNADSAKVFKVASPLDYHEPANNTWYDLAFTYNAITQKSYFYFAASGDSSFTDFLDGETDIAEGIGEVNNSNCNVQDIAWTACNILKELSDGSIGLGATLYIQNPMIFDGFLSSHDFNTLRRLNYLWAKKTGQYPK